MSMKVDSDIGRFAIVPLWLLEADLSSTAIRLFGVMAAKYADRKTGNLYPSRKQLAVDIGAKSPRTVDVALRELVKVGALTIEGRKDASNSPDTNLYTVHFIAHPPADNCAPIAENCTIPLATIDAIPSSKKLRTEPEGLLEPESIEPEYIYIQGEQPAFSETHSEEVWPDWYATLWAIPGFKIPLARANEWLRRKDIMDEKAEVTAYALKSKWPGDPKRPFTDPWATFQNWVKRPPLSTNGKSRATRVEPQTSAAALRESWYGKPP